MTDHDNTTTTTQLSPSSMAFLYAHRFTSAAEAGTPGTVSLANDGVVNTAKLGGRLLIVALWSLHSSGAVQLEPYREEVRQKQSVLFRTVENFASFKFKRAPAEVTYMMSGIRVKLLESTAIGGIEGDVLKVLAKRNEARDPLYEISSLARHCGFDGANPQGRVVQAAIDEVVRLGYAEIEATGVGAIKHKLTHKQRGRLIGRKAEIDALKPQVDHLVDQWNNFADEQVDLRQALEEQVPRTLESLRVEYEKRMEEARESYADHDWD